MGSLTNHAALKGCTLPPTAHGTQRRPGFWARIAEYLQRGFCAQILCGQHLSPALVAEMARAERELFVFTSPYSPQYQEPTGQGKGE
jgi:hypothetical protein